MGTGPSAKKHGARSKVKKYKKKIWLCHREKDLDQIQDDIQKQEDENQEQGKQQQQQPKYDDELPGGGQYYCIETGKHFINAKALADHKKSRQYKRRIKDLKEQTKYTQHDADLAAGMTREKLPPAHPRPPSTATTK